MHDIGHCRHYECKMADKCHRQLMYNKAMMEHRTYFDVIEPNEKDLKEKCDLFWEEETPRYIEDYNYLKILKNG